MDMSPKEIKSILVKQFKSEIRQVSRGGYDFLELEVKNKIRTKKFLGLIPFTEYHITKKIVFFGDSYTLKSTNRFGEIVTESKIDTLLDMDNNILYWRYSNH